MRIYSSAYGNIKGNNKELGSAISDIIEVLSEESINDAVGLVPPGVCHSRSNSTSHSSEGGGRFVIKELEDSGGKLIEVAVGISGVGVVGHTLLGLGVLDGVLWKPDESVVNQVKALIDQVNHCRGANWGGANG